MPTTTFLGESAAILQNYFRLYSGAWWERLFKGGNQRQTACKSVPPFEFVLETKLYVDQ
jgi:hypothetical protein